MLSLAAKGQASKVAHRSETDTPRLLAEALHSAAPQDLA